VAVWEQALWGLEGWRIAALAMVGIGESLLIGFLLTNREKRLRAESALRSKEEELWESRARYAAIVESSDDAIISKNLDGIILTWNQGAQKVFGYTEEEAVGQPITMIIPAELRDEERGILERVSQGEYLQQYETVRLMKAGKRVIVSLTISPVKDSAGKVVGVSKIARDITQRKRAEEELKRSEERFSKIFRQGPLAISLTSAIDHRYIDVNETFERFVGFRREELIGRSALEVGIWPDPEERARLVKRLLSEGSLHDFEFQFCKKDGQTRIAHGAAELIDISGEPCVLGLAIDVTERQRAQEALLESEKRFRLMADSAPVLMWLSGPDKLCTDFNQEWLKFTGRPIQEELGEGWVRDVHPDEVQTCLGDYNRAFDAREVLVTEYRLRRWDGQYRWMLDRGIPRFTENGGFAGYIGCCVDITEVKEAKAARAALSGKLIHAQEEERSRIARELHDDINQRLALVANGLEELQSGPGQDGSGVPYKKELGDLWQRMNEIASDIQQLSHRLHPAKLHYLGLAAAVRDLCQECGRQNKLRIECVVQDLPQDLEESASLSLFRVVQESLRNVAKHGQAHHVRVELAGESNTVRLRISDDGVGFNTSRVQSHGLGLVSMQERVRLTGGEFLIWSRPSQGTRVEVTIPIAARALRSTA
jgi:PAS domain S-box-containing protein